MVFAASIAHWRPYEEMGEAPLASEFASAFQRKVWLKETVAGKGCIADTQRQSCRGGYVVVSLLTDQPPLLTGAGCLATPGQRQAAVPPLHVALIKRRCSLHRGGGERYSVNLARGLMRLGHQVTVVGEELDPELRDEISFRQVRVTHLSSWQKNRSFARNALAAVEAIAPDVSYALCLTPGADLVRVTSRIHAEWMRIRYRHPWHAWLQTFNPRHRAVLELEAACYGPQAQTATVVAQSELDASLLRRHYGLSPERIQVIQNGVDTGVFKPQPAAAVAEVRHRLELPPHAQLLVFASYLDWKNKGIHALLQAMAKCDHPQLYLAVLGNGSVAPWRRLARQLGLDRRVRFLPRQQVLAPFLAAAELCVLPTAYEPFPNVLLEAMACGTPVLTTQWNGFVNLIEEAMNGYLVDTAESVRQITDHLNFHFEQCESRRKEMREEAATLAAGMHLTWHARQVEQALQHALQRRQVAA